MEVKKFIKLHMSNDNSPAIISTSDISNITYDVDEKVSIITLISGEESLEVKESVDKIYDMLSGKEKPETPGNKTKKTKEE